MRKSFSGTFSGRRRRRMKAQAQERRKAPADLGGRTRASRVEGPTPTGWPHKKQTRSGPIRVVILGHRQEKCSSTTRKNAHGRQPPHGTRVGALNLLGGSDARECPTPADCQHEQSNFPNLGQKPLPCILHAPGCPRMEHEGEKAKEIFSRLGESNPGRWHGRPSSYH